MSSKRDRLSSYIIDRFSHMVTYPVSASFPHLLTLWDLFISSHELHMGYSFVICALKSVACPIRCGILSQNVAYRIDLNYYYYCLLLHIYVHYYFILVAKLYI